MEKIFESFTDFMKKSLNEGFKLGKLTGEQTREKAKLIIGNGAKVMFFVHMSDDYAVCNEGDIYQIIYDNLASFKANMEKGVEYTVYKGKDCLYNYAEDSYKDLKGDDLEIYNHCLTMAEESI